jgi:hypothetical protein
MFMIIFFSMDIERLGLGEDNLFRVDSAFLDAALDRINHDAHLTEETITELEGIHDRTFDRAHDDIIAERPLSSAIASNLGKLSFIDTLGLPTEDIVRRTKTSKTDRVWWGPGENRRRLFRGTRRRIKT